MNTDMKLKVTEIQRFCMHDGPGIRTTVFLSGCPLRCAWCHNPETQSGRSELLFYAKKCVFCGACESACPVDAHRFEKDVHLIDREKCISCFACTDICPTGAAEKCGKDMSISDILCVIQKDAAFYGEMGGMTLSGGEPLMQGQKTVGLLKKCKSHGFSTAIETCGHAAPEVLSAAAVYTDLFLFDLKDTDAARHKRFTGVSNDLILQNLFLADSLGARILLRCILVNGINTNIEHYRQIAVIAASLSRLEGVEFLPYHAYGGAKSTFLGRQDSGKTEWIPAPEQIQAAKEYMITNGIAVI